MASSLADARYFNSFDGTRLAWYETGEGRPVVLIHGFFSDAYTNWLRWGHAQAIAARGFRVIMPDLRAHGRSDKPHDPGAYPPDALAQDGHALIAHLGLTDYDLGGYSLGGRTTLRMVVGGATPRRVVLSGMGLRGVTHPEDRVAHFRHILTHLGEHPRGSPEWLAEAFLKTTKGDAQALLGVLDTFVATDEHAIASVVQPTLVLTGDEDDDNGSAEALAGLLPHAIYRTVPGGHMSAVTRPELGLAIADFLSS